MAPGNTGGTREIPRSAEGRRDFGMPGLKVGWLIAES